MRARALLLAATVSLAGCGLLGVPGSVPGAGFQGGGSCSMMPGGACQEQMELAAARHPDAVQLDLACTVAVCNRAGGAGSVVVTLANGVKVTETFAYTGDPAPIPAPSCTGLPADVCRRVAASAVDDLPPSKRVASISIACSKAPCTRDRGDTAVQVTFADGTEFATGMGWEGGPP
jgi:hypothetical protein